jgi:hypothetical protein
MTVTSRFLLCEGAPTSLAGPQRELRTRVPWRRADGTWPGHAGWWPRFPRIPVRNTSCSDKAAPLERVVSPSGRAASPIIKGLPSNQRLEAITNDWKY